ncbi:hypothetical protein [Erythrobacter sp. F6033]|uniref:SecDF P1 head subdomain-containing protein n=1 Tax=Erythrobacter sp. F6033 TaxID=2926401 RepID=UPI001FF12DFE|nr:hypothetical protein [Erythrobacter sp. F6033]MCK0128808.1 hypothetical protein [Erythrobacter sp. F6033]
MSVLALIALAAVVEPVADASELLRFRIDPVNNTLQVSEFVLCSPRVYDAQIDADERTRELVLNVELGDSGKAWLAEKTAENVGRQMHIMIGSEIVSSPVINEAITGGTLSLTGLTVEENKRVQKALLKPCKMTKVSPE